MIAMTMAVVLRLLNNLYVSEKLTLIEWHSATPRVLSTVRVAAVSGEAQARPSKGDGPNISSVVGALGEGHCSTGLDDGFVRGSSCGGGPIDYFIRGVGRHVAWPSAFTATIRGQLSKTSRRSDAG
jgi:hypothetical protein